MCKDSCSECKKGVWIPDQYCKCDSEVLEEIMSNRDATIKQKEQAMKSRSGGAGIAYSMDYPVIIAAGVVLPKVYKGESGMPSTSKPELWQPLVTVATICEKGTRDAEEQESTTKLEEAVKEYETRNIHDYDEWTQTYETTWKYHAETSRLSLPSLVSSTSLVEEYWVEPDTRYKKWKRLRPTLDNFKQTLQMLTSEQMMRNQGIQVAGVRLWQAVGDSEHQVYNRLQRKDIRATDVFIVILDVEITKEITISEQKKHIDKYEDRGEQATLRKLFIPVKWSWSRVQKVCGKSAKQQIMVTLAKEAKQQRHNCWMNKYKECETLGMKPADNRRIIIVS